MIAKLQYISQATATQTHLEAIHAACNAGCKWIQLRLKNTPIREVETIAKAAKIICKKHGATFIINDYVSIAKAVKSDGIHLGKSDLTHRDARHILGNDIIIGGTANTFEDIQKYHEEGVVDYVGVGPFRFTTTKKELSPILGLEGYKQIIQQCNAADIQLPIIAIGGIQLTDIQDIMTTGLHGIAVSSLITKSDNKYKLIENIHTLLHRSVAY